MIVIDPSGGIAVLDPWPVPAAHSMDTDWYGVDRAGNVARLSSGEEGAVPFDAARQYWDELFEDLVFARIVARTPGDAQADPATLRRVLAAAHDPVEAQLVTAILAGDEHGREVYSDFLEQHGRALPRSVYVVERELREVDPATLPYEWNGILRFANREQLELFQALHQDEQRLLAHTAIPAIAARGIQQWAFDACWHDEGITAAYVIEQVLEPHAIGLYEYGCSFSGPYGRRAIPAEPLLVDDLPASLRETLGRLRIPVRFAATELLDPEQWFDCETYGR